MRSAIVSIATLSLWGCPSLTNMHTARPVEPGTTQLSFSGLVVGAGGLVDEENVVVPNVELQVRHGFDSWDIGIKAYPIGVQADFNILLSESSNFALSIDPAVTLLVASSIVGVYPWVALLFDIGPADGIVFTLGPRVGGAFGSAGGAGAILGGVAGVRFPLTENFAIVPEFTGYALVGDGAAFVWTGGIAFAFAL